MNARSRTFVEVMLAVSLAATLAACSSSASVVSSAGATSTASSTGCADVTALKASVTALTQVKPLQDGVAALQTAIANAKTDLDAAQVSASAALQPAVATVKSAFNESPEFGQRSERRQPHAEGAGHPRGASQARHSGGQARDRRDPGDCQRIRRRDHPVKKQAPHHLGKDVAMTKNRPLLDTLADMTAASVARANLSERELMLVPLAGLVAVNASSSVAYLLNLGPAVDSGLTLEDARSSCSSRSPRSWEAPASSTRPPTSPPHSGSPSPSRTPWTPTTSS